MPKLSTVLRRLWRSGAASVPPLCSRRPPSSIVRTRGGLGARAAKIWWRPPGHSGHPAGLGGGGTLTPLADRSTPEGRGCGPRHPFEGVGEGTGVAGQVWIRAPARSSLPRMRCRSRHARPPLPLPPSVAVVHSSASPPLGVAATTPAPPPTVTAYPTPPRGGALLGGPRLPGVEARPQRGAHGRTARVTARIYLGRAWRSPLGVPARCRAAAAAAAAAWWSGLRRCPRRARGRGGCTCAGRGPPTAAVPAWCWVLILSMGVKA